MDWVIWILLFALLGLVVLYIDLLGRFTVLGEAMKMQTDINKDTEKMLGKINIRLDDLEMRNRI